jgi:phosphoglycerate dehydrogenase-like enzyme
MKAVLYTFRPDDPVSRFRQDFPDLDWVSVDSPEAMAREVADAELVVLTNRVCTAELGWALRSASSSLGWIHFLTAGIERGIAMGLPPQAVISNSAGVRATTIAEHAMALLLAVVRRLPEAQAGQRAHEWRRVELQPRISSLQGATVCIVGLGAVGREVARKLKAFDAGVIAVSREGRSGDTIAAVFPREKIGEALGRADAVMICTNADASSHHLIGAAEFAATKAGAYLVNVARGEIIDEAALVEALRQGRLAGAGLDVTEAEPLPPESPLWDLPNVIISPHVAGGGAKDYAQQKDLFGRNLARYRAGETLINQCVLPSGG